MGKNKEDGQMYYLQNTHVFYYGGMPGLFHSLLKTTWINTS